MSTETPPDPLALFQSQRDASALEGEQLSARARNISWIRLITAAVGAASVWMALDAPQPLMLWVLVVYLLGVFVLLVRVHTKLRRKIAAAEASRRLYAMRIAAFERAWGALPAASVSREALPHWAAELDIVGDASLQRLLSGGLTVPGRNTVESWLLEPAGADEVLVRQQAVLELTAKMTWVDGIQVQAILAPGWSQRALTPFLEWAEGDKTAFRGGVAILFARAVTATVAIVTLLYGAALIDQKWLVAALLLSVVSGLFLIGRARKAIDGVQGKASPVQSFSRMLRTVEEAAFESGKLVELQQSLRDQSARASEALAVLRRLFSFAEVKYSPMMYVALQLTVLWDVHLNHSLEKWRREHGKHVRRWLAVLGEVEALSSLAALHHANPEWCFPDVKRPGSLDVLSGVDVAHPLLPDGGRVGNDVRVGGPGSFLLVTGSNMSGKSTLLRSVAVNSVLAQMGAPVCAREFSLPSVVLATSVQVQDSLEQGVSRFMAELLRLKEVLAVVRANAGSTAPMPLYLLDEILQGTNTAERQEGARLILSQLIHERCIGVVTTHDLALADAPELASAADPVHFSEGVEERNGQVVLSFEYKLRPGKATSVNALKLLRAVGLAGGGR